MNINSIYTGTNTSRVFYILIAFFSFIIIAPSGEAQIPITSCQEISTAGSYIMTQDVSSTGTCISITADAIILDCNDFSITYGTAGEGVGIKATDIKSIAISDCTILDKSESGEHGAGINLTNVQTSRITSNNIRTNGSFRNYGIQLTNSKYVTVANNKITTTGTADRNYGIHLSTDASNNRIENNSISTAGTDYNFGIINYISHDNVLRNNSITSSGTGSRNYGIFLSGGCCYRSLRNNITGNTITTSSAWPGGNNQGILLQSGSLQNTVENNTINTSGSGGNEGIRIDINSWQNIIRGNVIATSGWLGSNFGMKIAHSANDNKIINNSITTSHGAGIQVNVASRNLIADNIITSSGQSTRSDNHGVYIIYYANHNRIENNTIHTGGGGNTNHGVFVTAFTTGNNLTGNNISTNGKNGNSGVFLAGAPHSTITDNRISTNGIANNVAIHVRGADNSVFIGNELAAQGTDSYAIIIEDTSITNWQGNKLQNPVKWIRTSNAEGEFSGTAFTTEDGSILFNSTIIEGTRDITHSKLNITFNRTYINSTELPFFNTYATITLHSLPLEEPEIIVDTNDNGSFESCTSSSVPECSILNYSNTTLIFSVSHFTAYAARESTEETGSTLLSQCQAIDTGGNYVLTKDVSNESNCFRITADDVALNCEGYHITYGESAEGQGIVGQGNENISLHNCIITDRDPTHAGSIAVNLTSVNNAQIENNTIATNGTISNHGIILTESVNATIINNYIAGSGIGDSNNGILIKNSQNNSIRRNRIRTRGGADNYGILLLDGSSFNMLADNYIDTDGTGRGMGIRIVTSGDNNVENNTIDARAASGSLGNNYGIYVNGGVGSNQAPRNRFIANNITTSSAWPGGRNYGIFLHAGGSDSIIEGNYVTTSGSGSNDGIRLATNSKRNIISDNTVSTSGVLGSNFGIRLLFSSDDTLVENNTITTDRGPGIQLDVSRRNRLAENIITTTGIQDSYGIYLSFPSNNNLIEYNTISTSGSANRNYGIYLVAGAILNNISGNIITTDGFTDNHGIYLTTANKTTVEENQIAAHGGVSHGIQVGQNSYYNTFDANTVTASGAGSYGLFLLDSNESTFSGTVLNNSAEWISATNIQNISFTNTTFATGDGSINYADFTINGDASLTHNILNTTFNKTFVDVQALPFLNSSAVIILLGLTFTDPEIIVDVNDDGIFTSCNETTDPVCSIISFTSEILTFTVDHFTTYSAQEK
jgi:parallel beta-helix repeat protein